MGLDPDLLLASSAPSPGEARKLKMAYGLGLQVWALVLDEPTNHLDLQAIERLEAALAAYPGALVGHGHSRRRPRRRVDDPNVGACRRPAHGAPPLAGLHILDEIGEN